MDFHFVQPAIIRSHINDEVEDEQEGQQVAEQEDESTFVLVITTTHEIDESLRAIIALVVFCDCEAHYDTNNKSAKMAQVVHVRLRQTNLDVEEQDEQDEDYEGEALHWVRFAEARPLYYQVGDLEKAK